jgi:micrococcal nuclease
VVDGDTYDVVLDLGFRQYTLVTLRLLGVDTAELNAQDPRERERARAARARAVDLLLDRHVLVRTFKDRQTFGRYVAQVWVVGPEALSATAQGDADDESLRLGTATTSWRPLAAILLAEGLGRPA